MKRLLIFLLAALAGSLYSYEPHFMADPAISPDGEKVCFVYDGDLWIVPFKGGTAERLTNTIGDESGPVFSPDGKEIAFNATREGYNSVYTISATGGKSRQVSKESLTVIDWFKDGDRLLCTGYDPEFGEKFYTVDTDGDDLRDLNIEGSSFASLSPDNEKIVYCVRGYADREAYTGSKNGELWMYNFENDKYTKLTDTDFTERYPVYSRNNEIYYSASDGNLFQIYKSPENDLSKRTKLSDFDIWSARDLSIAKSNDRVVYEFFDKLGKYDPATGENETIKIDIDEDINRDFEVSQRVNSSAREINISPNGDWFSFVYKFDLFAVPVKGGKVIQVTKNQPGIDDVVIMSDNKTAFFTAYKDGLRKLYSFKIDKPEDVTYHDWSDDKDIENIYLGGAGLCVVYSKGNERDRLAYISDKDMDDVEVLIDDAVTSGYTTSEDERYAFYVEVKPELYSRHLFVYDRKKDKKTMMVNYDGWMANLVLSNDGKSLFMNQGSDIKRVDLVPRDDYENEKDNWADVLKEDDKKEEKSDDKDKKEDEEKVKELKIKYGDFDERLHTVVSRDGWNYIIHVADSTFYYVNNYNDKNTLRKVDFYGKNDKQVTTLPENFDYYNFNEKTNKLYYVSNKYVYSTGLEAFSPKAVKFDFKYKYNKHTLLENSFDEMWAMYGKHFYDPNMHGRDWNALYERFKPFMKYCYNGRIFDAIATEMIGEVNASHSEFSGNYNSGAKWFQRASLGAEFDYTKPLSEGVKVKKVYSASQLSEVYGIKKGDVLLSVDGVEINEKNPLSYLLLDKIGDKIRLVFDTKKGEKEVFVKGLGWGKNSLLRYDNWVKEREEKVNKLSKGRIGYLHIRGMNQYRFQKFLQDMFANNYYKDALIIDVRYNGGGNISEDLIKTLTHTQFGISTSRKFGAKKVPQPRNIWAKPVVLLINEDSASDAEIFPILFKEKKFGKVIGTPTSGYVIGTWGHELMDGSSMRLPSEGWYRLNGVNMEGNGAIPDIIVVPSVKDRLNDNDVQLQRGVKELLKELNK